MRADLHLHSTHSDGTFTPKELVDEAKRLGIEAIAICDHNLISGSAEAAGYARENGILLIPGVEIDAGWNGMVVHVLALGIDFKNNDLTSLLEENTATYDRFNEQLIGFMEKDYPELSLKEYLCYEREPSFGGWNGIDYLRSKGFDTKFPECMQYYREYPCELGSFLNVAAVCGAIHRAGGVAILAHIGNSMREQSVAAMLDMLSEMVEAGIDGAECFYPSHGRELTDALIDFCQINGLLITGGSDHHGEFAKEVRGITYSMEAFPIVLKNRDVERIVKEKQA